MCYKRIKRNLLGRFINLSQKKQYFYLNNKYHTVSNIKNLQNFDIKNNTFLYLSTLEIKKLS